MAASSGSANRCHLTRAYSYAAWTHARESWVANFLRDVDFNLLCFGFLALRHVDREHAVLEFSLYLARVGHVRKAKGPHESAVGSFDPMIFLLLLFLFELAFTGDGKNAVFNGDFYILLFYIRQLGFNHVLFVVFGDVGERRPIGQGDFVVAVTSATENPGKAVLHVFQFQWFPAGECIYHGDSSCWFPAVSSFAPCFQPPVLQSRAEKIFGKRLLLIYFQLLRTSPRTCPGNLSSL